MRCVSSALLTSGCAAPPPRMQVPHTCVPQRRHGLVESPRAHFVPRILKLGTFHTYLKPFFLCCCCSCTLGARTQFIVVILSLMRFSRRRRESRRSRAVQEAGESRFPVAEIPSVAGTLHLHVTETQTRSATPETELWWHARLCVECWAVVALEPVPAVLG